MKIELVVGVSNSSPPAMPPVTKDLVENPFRWYGTFCSFAVYHFFHFIFRNHWCYRFSICLIARFQRTWLSLKCWGRARKSLRNYVRRYWAMYDEVEKNTCSERLAVAFFKQSLPHGDRLWTSLVMSPVSSIAELYSRVSRYAMLEDVLGHKGYAKREYTRWRTGPKFGEVHLAHKAVSYTHNAAETFFDKCNAYWNMSFWIQPYRYVVFDFSKKK